MKNNSVPLSRSEVETLAALVAKKLADREAERRDEKTQSEVARRTDGLPPGTVTE